MIGLDMFVSPFKRCDGFSIVGLVRVVYITGLEEPKSCSGCLSLLPLLSISIYCTGELFLGEDVIVR